MIFKTNLILKLLRNKNIYLFYNAKYFCLKREHKFEFFMIPQNHNSEKFYDYFFQCHHAAHVIFLFEMYPHPRPLYDLVTIQHKTSYVNKYFRDPTFILKTLILYQHNNRCSIPPCQTTLFTSLSGSQVPIVRLITLIEHNNTNYI